MPGPVRRPTETVRPEVSECSRMPARRRPVSRAATPWAPSWAIVTTCRVTGHSRRDSTRAPATRATAARTAGVGAGCTAIARDQTAARASVTSDVDLWVGPDVVGVGRLLPRAAGADLAGNADHNGAGWDVAHDHRVRAD